MKILIIGITGQLGKALEAEFKLENIEIYGTSNKSLSEINNAHIYNLDIINSQKVNSIFKKIMPDVVINTAAMTNVDKCEIDMKLAYMINVGGNKNLLMATKSINSKFVFISTYYIFNGKKGFYNEKDLPDPLNYYGQTKLIAEKDTLRYENTLIIRPSKIFSWGYDDRNFIARLYTSLINKKSTYQTNDQWTNPILANDLARIIKQLILKNKKGIFHIGGLDYLNNCNFAVRFAKFFNLNKKFIKPITSKKMNQTAQRPKKCGLELDKVLKENIKPLNLEKSFGIIKKYMKKNE